MTLNKLGKFIPMGSRVAVRETLVLLLGVAISLAASRFGNAGAGFPKLAVAILLPIAFCLARAKLVKLPTRRRTSPWRCFLSQLAFAAAFILLLLFEMGVALFAGSADIPVGFWVVLGCFGFGYIALFLVARSLADLHDTYIVN